MESIEKIAETAIAALPGGLPIVVGYETYKNGVANNLNTLYNLETSAFIAFASIVPELLKLKAYNLI